MTIPPMSSATTVSSSSPPQQVYYGYPPPPHHARPFYCLPPSYPSHDYTSSYGYHYHYPTADQGTTYYQYYPAFPYYYPYYFSTPYPQQQLEHHHQHNHHQHHQPHHQLQLVQSHTIPPRSAQRQPSSRQQTQTTQSLQQQHSAINATPPSTANSSVISSNNFTPPSTTAITTTSTTSSPLKGSRWSTTASTTTTTIKFNPESAASIHLKDYALVPEFSAAYSLKEEIGCGQHAFVVRAERSVDRRPVAVKFIFKTGDEGARQRPLPTLGPDRLPLYGPKGTPFLTPYEIFILRRAASPGVVAFLDYYEDSCFIYLVMEHHGIMWTANEIPPPTHPRSDPTFTVPQSMRTRRRSSCDLFNCIEHHQRLDEPLAGYVFSQLAQAVYDLDQMGICHTDLRDENITIDANFKVKLVDFGFAVMYDRKKPPLYLTGFYGSLDYASAEIHRHENYRPQPAEVWALGVILHLLVTGMLPFVSHDDAMRGKIRSVSCDVAVVSAECTDLLERCFDTDPRSRISIRHILRHPFILRHKRRCS